MIDFISVIFEHFGDPRKRVFLGYLFLSILIAFLWLFLIQGYSIRGSFKYIFDKKILLSTSSRSDFFVFLINRSFLLFISPLLISQLAVATIIFHSLHYINWLHSGMFSDTSTALIITFFTIFVFILDDFTKYFVHRWMHKWPILWSLHKVHHSATTLTPLTIYRTHPLEGVLFILRGSFAQGVSISLFVFLFGNSVDIYTILGVNIIVFMFNALGANLRHSHIGIQYWKWLEYILISPAQHQLHHSVAEKHYDKNFGATLAIWDWLFGSLSHSENVSNLKLGVILENSDSPHKITNLYLQPLIEINSLIRKKTKKIIRFFSKFKKISNRN